MATWTSETKNNSTWSSTSKNSSTWSEETKSGSLIYLVTSALDFILVGSAENETMVAQDGIQWATQTKS